MTQTLTIAIFNETTHWSLPSTLVERIRQQTPDGVVVRQASTRHELLELLPETDHLVGFPLTQEQVLHAAPKLKWVQLTNSPGDALGPLVAALSRGVRVTSAASMRAPQVAEHAVALILALVRRIDAAVLAQQEHRWGQFEIAAGMRSLMGSTVGIVAVGSVGQEIAQRVKAFGVRVLATRRNPANPYLYVDEMLPTDRVGDLLKQSDIVVVAAPRLPATRNMLSKREFAMMKPNCLLVDVGRGSVINEPAMIEALRKGRIAGAGLDAFDAEPLPVDSALWSTPNVIITPHVSSVSPDYWGRAAEIVTHNLTRLVEGRPLVDEVTPDWLEGKAAG